MKMILRTDGKTCSEKKTYLQVKIESIQCCIGHANNLGTDNPSNSFLKVL